MTAFCINFEVSSEWIWMNIKDHFCLSPYLLPAENVHIFVIANIQSFTSQIFGIVGPLGENLNSLACWDLKFKQILITKAKKPSSTQSDL